MAEFDLHSLTDPPVPVQGALDTSGRPTLSDFGILAAAIYMENANGHCGQDSSIFMHLPCL